MMLYYAQLLSLFIPGKFVQKQRKEFQDRLADAGTQAEEALSSVRTVRMFSGETKVKELYGRDIDKSYRVGRKLALAQGRHYDDGGDDNDNGDEEEDVNEE